MVARALVLAFLFECVLGFRKPKKEMTDSQEAALQESLNNPIDIQAAFQDLALSLHEGNYTGIDAKLRHISELTGEPYTESDGQLKPAAWCEIGCTACIGATYLTCVAPPYGECAFAVIGCVAACGQCITTLCAIMPVRTLCDNGFPIPSNVCQACYDWHR